MTDLEIPHPKDRNWRYRFFEALPGLISWTMLLLPLILSLINVTLAAVFILVYLLINFMLAMALATRLVQGYHIMKQHQRLNWQVMLADLEAGKVQGNSSAKRPKWHRAVLSRLGERPVNIKPSEIIQAVIVATYKEAREVLEPTIESLLASEYNMRQVIFVLAYEERAGERTEALAHELVQKYGARFMHAMAVKHPSNIPGETIGKGGNVTYAGRELQRYLEKHDIDPARVIVTTLDADNRPHKKYLAALSYTFAVCPDPIHASFQPVSIYTNNIWDAPAPMRVVATGNSFFNIVLSLRPHALRNFSSHAQPMAALIQTDFWSTRSIVEDGHQFWRSYFTFDGNYRVYPLYVPIYQDAVLSEKYIQTLKAQFIQLRRWAWGASDVSYVIDKGYFRKNKVPRLDLLAKLLRLLQGHVTWAVGAMLVLFAGFVPSLLRPQSFTANELPLIVSHVQTVALVGAVLTVFFALKTLPPKPARYRKHRSILMVLQWGFLPVTSILYNSFAALYSQTRLIFGWYIDKFDVTEKAVVTEEKETIT
ncbi:MAG TPA: glycosyltransferase family 2 protein [Candidatus Saccharimonadales bacterium]|jgi:cellulose synthase/poly-beta-1,6-N-acetylglucosamine synthase-like glycosyltransferase